MSTTVNTGSLMIADDPGMLIGEISARSALGGQCTAQQAFEVKIHPRDQAIGAILILIDPITQSGHHFVMDADSAERIASTLHEQIKVSRVLNSVLAESPAQ